MPLPASLKSCRSHPSPAIRSSLCRSTLWPRRTGLDFARSEFLRDRLKKNSKQCSSLAKLKRKRRPYQVGAEEAALGPNTCRACTLRGQLKLNDGAAAGFHQVVTWPLFVRFDLPLLPTGVVLYGMEVGLRPSMTAPYQK